MKRYMVSKVCRIAAEAVAKIAEVVDLVAGKNLIPETALAPRQIKLRPGLKDGIAATIKWHRDGYVATVSPAVAGELVRDRVAEFCPQWLLCYTVAIYKADPEVKNDPDEMARIMLEGLANDDLVVVAVIGEGRSPHRVCSNIAEGSQNPLTLEEDAKGALEAASTFLVEDPL